MRAILQQEYGSAAAVLALGEADRPPMGDSEVLVRVHAAGAGPHVWHMVTGRPYLARLGAGLRAPKARIPRSDLAGTVEAVGRLVPGFRPGDAVYGTAPGALAEYASTPADRLAPKPGNLTFEQAAVVPVSACAALHALRDMGRVGAGQEVLIIGASGGVGTFAVQIAKASGARVTGVCSAANLDLVRSLGADDVIDYTRQDVTDGAHRYDLIIDVAGRRPLWRLRKALRPRGTLVIVGGEGGGAWTGGFGRAVIRAPLLSLITRQRLRPLISVERQADLVDLNELIEAGKVTPVVSRTFPLSQAPEALDDANEGHGRGKAVIIVTAHDDPGRPTPGC